MRRRAQASVHGRFQPFHNGHLEYVLAAKQRCDFLWIGITQPDISALVPSPQDPHRHEIANNPLTYEERREMISEVMLSHGLSTTEFEIIRFPIETPERLPDILPVSVPVFTTVYDPWNVHKIQILQKVGYEVLTLWERVTKTVDGIAVRELIRTNDPGWREKVPEATAEIIEKYRIRERLDGLTSEANGAPYDQ